MSRSITSISLTVGVTLFSLLFGAGNLIFPPWLGFSSPCHIWISLCGFVLTAIGIPLLVFYSSALFEGDYIAYFAGCGPTLARIFITLSMFLIGPFFAMPRLLTVAYELSTPFISISLISFSLCFVILAFGLVARRRMIFIVLGKILSPLLVILVFYFIGYGLWGTSPIPSQKLVGSGRFFFRGMFYGYNTLDGLAALFFSSLIMFSLRRGGISTDDKKKILIYGSLISCILLALAYIGLGLLGVVYSMDFQGIHQADLLSYLAYAVLGEQQAILFSVLVIIACLSSFVGYASIVARWISKTSNTISYQWALAMVLFISFITAQLGLVNIIELSQPALIIVYPLLLIAAIFNIIFRVQHPRIKIVFNSLVNGKHYLKRPMLITLISLLILYGVISFIFHLVFDPATKYALC